MLRQARRTTAAGVLVAALVASCTADPSPSDRRHSGLTSLRLSRLPPIAQDGANAADASGAESVLLASAEPARAGVAVRLQQRTASGWRTLGRSTTDGYGFAQFRAPQTSVQGRSPDLRVVSRATPRVRSSGTVTDDWRLTFSDEFAGSTLGAKWDYRALGVLSGSSRRRVSASSKEAVRVRDGTLRLQVRADPRRKGHYLNGHIGTERAYSFRYGIAAARIRFQRPRGTHGAFWSQSPTVNDFPGDPARAGTEIDIGEYFGDGYPRGGMASYVYHYDKGGTNRKDGDVLPRAVSVVGSADSFWTRFHVYSVEWSPEGYVFRIDGRVTYRTNTAVSARTQYLVLSLLSSDWELPDLDKRLLPATMLVDWVRVWQRSG